MSTIKHIKIVATFEDGSAFELSEPVAACEFDVRVERIEIEPRNGYHCYRPGALTVSLKVTTLDPGPK